MSHQAISLTSSAIQAIAPVPLNQPHPFPTQSLPGGCRERKNVVFAKDDLVALVQFVKPGVAELKKALPKCEIKK